MIPVSGGLHHLLLTEMYCITLAAHSGVCKIVYLLFFRFFCPIFEFLWLILLMAVIYNSISRIPHSLVLGCYNLYQSLKGNSRTLVSNFLWIYHLVRGLTKWVFLLVLVD